MRQCAGCDRRRDVPSVHIEERHVEVLAKDHVPSDAAQVQKYGLKF